MPDQITANTAKEIEILFVEGISLSSKLEFTLDNERQALENQDRHRLETLSELKSNQLDLLSSNDHKLIDMLTKSGIPKEVNGIDTLISLTPLKQQTELFKLWDNHKVKLKACKEKNIINGRIIERSRSVVDHLLNIINSGGPPQASLYEASGKSNPQEGSRTIAKA